MTTALQVTVQIPGVLRDRCRGKSLISVSAATVRQALACIEREFPELHRGICDETGAVRRHVNLFVNSDNTRDLQGVDTPLRAGDTLTVLPAVSGG